MITRMYHVCMKNSFHDGVQVLEVLSVIWGSLTVQALLTNKILSHVKSHRTLTWSTKFIVHRRGEPTSRGQHANLCATTSSDNFKSLGKYVTSILAAISLAVPIASARPEGVNKPELLPKEFTTLIDVSNYLTKGEERKVVDKIADLEKSTGFKLRVLCQSYPNTPGLAIKDYWKVDDNTLVMVIDQGEGFNSKGIPRNIINLNIGKNVEDTLSNLFWSRLSNKLGTTYYVKEKGIDTAILNAVEAITYCLTNKECKDLPFEL